MVLTIEADLEATIRKQAQSTGESPEKMTLNALREKFGEAACASEPQDEWERRLRRIGTPCGVTLSNEALSREEMYD